MTNIPQVRLSFPYKKVSKIINNANDASETWSWKNERKNGKLDEVINIRKITYNHKCGNGPLTNIFSLL